MKIPLESNQTQDVQRSYFSNLFLLCVPCLSFPTFFPKYLLLPTFFPICKRRDCYVSSNIAFHAMYYAFRTPYHQIYAQCLLNSNIKVLKWYNKTPIFVFSVYSRIVVNMIICVYTMCNVEGFNHYSLHHLTRNCIYTHVILLPFNSIFINI